MLRENPQQRPNIYQVIREVCLMRGTDIPIKDVSSSPLFYLIPWLILPDIFSQDTVRGSKEPTSTIPRIKRRFTTHGRRIQGACR